MLHTASVLEGWLKRLMIALFRKTVMMLLSIMDPDGTENRKQRKIITVAKLVNNRLSKNYFNISNII